MAKEVSTQERDEALVAERQVREQQVPYPLLVDEEAARNARDPEAELEAYYADRARQEQEQRELSPHYIHEDDPRLKSGEEGEVAE